MNMRRIATQLLIFPLLALTLMACDSFYEPVTAPIDGSHPYTAAQSTLDYGQSQMDTLSQQATMVGMDIAQAANTAKQATEDYNQRQMIELAYQATAISLNMSQAVATQQFITEQTQMAWNAKADSQSQAATAAYSAYNLLIMQTAKAQGMLDLHAAETARALVVTQQFDTKQTQIAWNAEGTAQSQAATATYSAYSLNVTQTAQAQMILNAQATQAAQANATHVAYSLTATPWAALQSEIVRSRDEADRRALWGEFVVTPLKVILITLVIILLIVGGVMAYRRLVPILELRLRTIARYNKSPLLLVDGMIVDADHPLYRPFTQRELQLPKDLQLSSDELPHIEIVGPSEPSVVNWITEAEIKLLHDGWIHP